MDMKMRFFEFQVSLVRTIIFSTERFQWPDGKSYLECLNIINNAFHKLE